MNTQMVKNFEYMDEDTQTSVSSLSNEEWDKVCAASAAYGFGDVGIDTEVAVTQETLNDFKDSRTRWSERGIREIIEVAEAKWATVKYSNMQTVKGERRHTILVIDLGNIRVVLKSW